jgi:hypothetical protein
MHFCLSSYGGHYIPELATVIVNAMDQDEPDSLDNFKGFLLGNPYTDPEENSVSSHNWSSSLWQYVCFLLCAHLLELVLCLLNPADLWQYHYVVRSLSRLETDL